MKTIIAGSRQVSDFIWFNNVLISVLHENNINLSEIVSGTAKGADQFGERFGAENNIPVKKFPADWNNLNVENCSIGTNTKGYKYNKVAGHQRNQKMADYSDLLIAFHYDNSTGTKDMINRMKKLKKPVIVIVIDKSWNAFINYDYYVKKELF